LTAHTDGFLVYVNGSIKAGVRPIENVLYKNITIHFLFFMIAWYLFSVVEVETNSVHLKSSISNRDKTQPNKILLMLDSEWSSRYFRRQE